MSVCVCIKGGNLQRIPLYTSLSKGTTVLVFQGRNIFSQRQCFINICIHIIHGFMGQNTPVPICLSGENLCYSTTARRNMLYMLYSVVVFFTSNSLYKHIGFINKRPVTCNKCSYVTNKWTFYLSTLTFLTCILKFIILFTNVHVKNII